MKMQKRQFRIGELAKTLNVERFVIRFWEKEFHVRSERSDGGQRFYSERDLIKFQKIKTLLYEQGFTIAGAKKQLGKVQQEKETLIIGSHKTSLEADQPEQPITTESIIPELINIRQKLHNLKLSITYNHD